MIDSENRLRQFILIAGVLILNLLAIKTYQSLKSNSDPKYTLLIGGLVIFLSLALILFRKQSRLGKKKTERLSPEERKRLAGITVTLNSLERAFFRNRIILSTLIFAVFTAAIGSQMYSDYFRWQGTEQISGYVTEVKSSHYRRRDGRSVKRGAIVSISATVNDQKITDSFYTSSRTEYKIGQTRPFLILLTQKDGVTSYKLNGLDEPKKDVTYEIVGFLIVLVFYCVFLVSNARPLIAGTTTLDKLPKKYRDIRKAIR